MSYQLSIESLILFRMQFKRCVYRIFLINENATTETIVHSEYVVGKLSSLLSMNQVDFGESKTF